MTLRSLPKTFQYEDWERATDRQRAAALTIAQDDYVNAMHEFCRFLLLDVTWRIRRVYPHAHAIHFNIDSGELREIFDVADQELYDPHGIPLAPNDAETIANQLQDAWTVGGSSYFGDTDGGVAVAHLPGG